MVMELIRENLCRSAADLLRELALDIGSDLLRRGRRGKALHDASLLVHQELGEVPLDGVAKDSTFFAFKELVQRMCAVTVDLDLREHRKVDAVIGFAKRLDLVVAGGLLVTELVAGKAQDLKSAVVILGVEILQSLVLRGESALAGGVDYEQDLARVGGEGLVGTVVQFGGEIVDGHDAFRGARADGLAELDRHRRALPSTPSPHRDIENKGFTARLCAKYCKQSSYP